ALALPPLVSTPPGRETQPLALGSVHVDRRQGCACHHRPITHDRIRRSSRHRPVLPANDSRRWRCKPRRRRRSGAASRRAVGQVAGAGRLGGLADLADREPWRVAEMSAVIEWLTNNALALYGAITGTVGLLIALRAQWIAGRSKLFDVRTNLKQRLL